MDAGVTTVALATEAWKTSAMSSPVNVRPLWIAACALALAPTLACGGSPKARDPGGVDVEVSVHEEKVTGRSPTRFQRARLLGHYSTYDGASGFILDRTHTPWRAKLDGSDTVVTLAAAGTEGSDAKDYVSADRSVWIRVGDEGDVQLFDGPKQREGVEVVRDADADPL